MLWTPQRQKLRGAKAAADNMGAPDSMGTADAEVTTTRVPG